MKKNALPILVLVLILGGAWFIWQWGFCRFYVDPDEMAIVIAKVGDPLPQGQILAAQGQKGVREEVLAEGRHFLNPILYDHKIVEVTIVPPGGTSHQPRDTTVSSMSR